ncbi:MAG: PspC domain-containing protein [Enterococcus sp.]
MQKRLTKSKNNVVLTGTLGGIGEYIGVDPTIIRIIYIVLSLMAFGSPIILYIFLVILVPSARSSRGYGHDNQYYKNNQKTQGKRKEAEKVDDDDWSDF